MGTQSINRLRVAALILSFVGLTLAASSVPVYAQSSQSAWALHESPTAALDRHIRVLARSPKDFLALIGAGKAALALGDNHAAVGFFGRADEVFPSSPLPHVGMGAASVADGDAYTAMRYFARAQQLGAAQTLLGADRGLAFDLIGRHSDAQADYRAAMAGTDTDEARRRLALSLAITGDKAGALELLGPLVARGDAAGARCRALVLALSGELDGARRSLDAAMPGSAVRMAPFLAKLPSLRSDQKAAAVNLGIFPNTGQPSYAYAPVAETQSVASQPAPRQPAVAPPSRTAAKQPRSSERRASSVAGAVSMSGDRLASIDQLLRPSDQAAAPRQTAAERTVQVASIPPQARNRLAGGTSSPSTKPRIWVQLASGSNSAALPEQFQRIKSRYSDILEGMGGYVAETAERARLLVGPFRSASEANIVVGDLESVRVNAFRWTSPAGQMIRKLPAE